MAFTVSNSTVTNSSNIEASGNILYFRPGGTGSFIDMGWISVPQPTINTTTNDLTRNRDGVAVLVKSSTASITKTIAFNTTSVQDPGVIRLFTGGTPVAGTGSYTDVTAIKETLKPTEGDAIIVRKPTESTGLIKVTYYPKASLRPTGEGEDSGYSTYEFELSVLSDPTYTPPTAFGDIATTAETGINYLVTATDLAALLTALADS